MSPGDLTDMTLSQWEDALGLPSMAPYPGNDRPESRHCTAPGLASGAAAAKPGTIPLAWM
jgi:hypothetical protein